MDQAMRDKLDYNKVMRKQQEEITEAVKVLSKYVNGFNTEKEVATMFHDSFIREHRTLQQSMMKSLFSFIKMYAGCEYYDARNEGSVLACKKLKEVLEECHLPLI